MLRKPLVLVFMRFRVMARHHEELLLKGFDKSNREASTIYYLLPTTYYLQRLITDLFNAVHDDLPG